MGDAKLATVKVLFFAKAREISGNRLATLTIINNPSYDFLLNKIVTTFSLEKIRDNILLAVNEEYCNKEVQISLKDGDEIAVIPPISGGTVALVNLLHARVMMDFIEIVNSKLSLEEISGLVSKSTCGAVSFFVGTTREYFEDKKVIHLEYEAYEPMAIKAIKRICEDIRGKWKVENIAVYHRIGVVPVKEASVVIAVSSVHRSDSLQAVQYAIDNLKSCAPIWKKEVYEISTAEWKENQESQRLDEHTLEEHSYIKSEEKLPLILIEEQSVPSHLIQIKADADEIQRRINMLVKRKREGIDLGNVRDFCQDHGQITKESSCARVDAILVRRKDSKGHLRVRRVLNKWGPQTQGLDPGSMIDPNLLDELVTGKNITCDVSSQCATTPSQGTEERLSNAENYLHISSGAVPKDVYARLKQIEDKILYLESISPEYSSWGHSHDKKIPRVSIKNKKVYTINDMERKIVELEMQLAEKE